VFGCIALQTLHCYNNQLTEVFVRIGYTGFIQKDEGVEIIYMSYDDYEWNLVASQRLSSYATWEAIDGVQRLTRIIAVGQNLTGSIDLSGCTALQVLDCSSNQLTSLDVSQNTALYYLDCSGNQLTSLDVSQNTTLQYLDCNSNQLTSLDVSQNTTLHGLYCDGNQLSKIYVPVGYTGFIQKDNGAEIIYGSPVTSDGYDIYEWNLVTSQGLFSYATWETIDGVQRLTGIYANGQNLSGSIDLSGCTALQYLF
jgi:Leucine-rich repeat (LRR) protein